jgi:5-methylcytosine-specific restriction endonuclease McrA
MCECIKKDGTKCTKKPKDGFTKCHVHIKGPAPSRKFISRFSTLMHAVSEDISKRLPKFEIDCDQTVCYYCKKKLEKYTRTKDHIVSLVENSWFNKLTNLTNATVPCCRGCNQRKGNKKIDLPFEITEEYVFEREEELRDLVNQLKEIMRKIQEIILTSPIKILHQRKNAES